MCKLCNGQMATIEFPVVNFFLGKDGRSYARSEDLIQADKDWKERMYAITPKYYKN